ncbi:DUF4307 domain-containing protein [Ruania suaedae]|uniref:DUF4307 domain-containing protein n=1 Tax=Ruania suaedae TaxID=2897774 RepID=UPI001E5FE119|nr:DUF4307 domain-containing protein [Ruania suaedae]UFU02329.1 DUF4307 domain-containing protein [Ruania suaedae]
MRPGDRDPEDVAALMARRYGRSAEGDTRRRRRTWVVAAVCAVLGLSALAMVTVGLLEPTVSSQDVGFEVLDAETVRVTFDVTRPAGREAQCTLEALHTGFGQVGLLEVPVPVSQGHTDRMTVEIATTELATTGIVRECRLLD